MGGRQFYSIEKFKQMELFNEFIEAVDKMRELQTEYFSGRDLIVLGQSKAAENKVDRLLKALLSKPQEDKKTGLNSYQSIIEVRENNGEMFVPKYTSLSHINGKDEDPIEIRFGNLIDGDHAVIAMGKIRNSFLSVSGKEIYHSLAELAAKNIK
mgnify:CR=1 FL=1